MLVLLLSRKLSFKNSSSDGCGSKGILDQPLESNVVGLVEEAELPHGSSGAILGLVLSLFLCSRTFSTPSLTALVCCFLRVAPDTPAPMGPDGATNSSGAVVAGTAIFACFTEVAGAAVIFACFTVVAETTDFLDFVAFCGGVTEGGALIRVSSGCLEA